MSSTTNDRMTTGAQASRRAVTDPGDQIEYYEPEAGEGWLFFAASMLGIAGIMRIIDSIWAFGYHGALPEGLKNGVLGSNLDHYAWLWLAVGSLLILSSFLVMVRSQFARWIGFFAAAIGAISAVVWLPYYPVWSLVYIGLAVLVFYSLAAYGGRERA